MAKINNKGTVKIGSFTIGRGYPLALIAGPCVIENERSAVNIARFLKNLSQKLGFPLIFKASYDKANRTSIDSYRGPGKKEGLRILAGIKKDFDIPILTDVHCQVDVDEVALVADVVQVPAFLCRQTDLLRLIASKAKCINIKKGQFLAPQDMEHVITKVERAGNKNILVTERGNSFGYNFLVVDMCNLPILHSFGYPVIFDVTHSLQMPGALGHSSGGRSRLVPYLARAGVACGCDGIFLEVHPNPDIALSDGPNSIALKNLEYLLRDLMKIDKIIQKVRDE